MEMRETDQTSSGLIELVSRRYDFLTVLDTDPYEKRTLQDELEVSRSTVDRAIRELETGNLVQRIEDGYRTTLYGRSMLAIYESVLTHTEYVQSGRTLLATLSPDVEFDLNLLVNAEIYFTKEPALHVPTTQLIDRIEEATRLRGLAYAQLSPSTVDLLERKVRSEDMEAEIVFRREMYEYIEGSQKDKLERVADSERAEIHVLDEIPYGLFLVETGQMEEICLTVYGQNQNLKGIIINDRSDAVSWAGRAFERYRSEAREASELV